MVMSDNTTVVAYINHQGGTRSLSLAEKSVELLEWCRCEGILLKAKHIPGSRNVLADRLSRRNQVQPHEWSLDQTIFNRILKVLHPNLVPTVDLFAMKENKKLPNYASPIPDGNALAVDALSISWRGMVAYAFPPTPLVLRVIEKVKFDQCELLLIAPRAETNKWARLLWEVLAGDPIELPLFDKLLRQQGWCHTCPESLHLIAWPLSGNPQNLRVFPERRLISSFDPLGNPQIVSMRHDGGFFPSGVEQKGQYHLRHLPRW
jgi:hypothetical protein